MSQSGGRAAAEREPSRLTLKLRDVPLGLCKLLVILASLVGGGLFPWLNELATRLHFAKYAVRGKAVDVAKLAYGRRIDFSNTD